MTTASIPYYSNNVILDWSGDFSVVADEWLSESQASSDEFAPTASTASAALGDTALADAIAESRAIAELGDDWDGEGSPGYAQATLDRAARFLTELSDVAVNLIGIALPVPFITPAENGSIDVFWRLSGKTLLVNFPANPDETPSFYGESAGDSTTSGLLGDGEKRADLVLWLTPLV